MNKSEMHKKITFLNNNASLGTQLFADNLKSNCFGTACYIFGIDAFLEQYYQEVLIKNKLSRSDYYNMNKTDKIILSSDKNRPGFCGRLPFKLAVNNGALFEEVQTPSLYALVVYAQKDDLIRHAGVFLHDNLVFHQNNLGGLFETINSNQYKCTTPLQVKYYELLI